MSRSSSAVVDSKVVEMSLDNQNFEKNAQISMSTLKKLQEALDFSNSTDGLDKVNSSVKKVNFDPLLNGIDKVKVSFNALDAVAFGVFSNIGTKISDLAIKVATAIPRQIIEGGKKRAMNMEQAKFQMEGLAAQGLGAGWEEEIDTVVTKLSEKEKELAENGQMLKDTVAADVDYAVAGTAYGLDEAATVAGQLMASSVKVGDDMRSSLRGISGVAAMTNSSYSEIGHIYTTIAGNGRLMTEQLNQFSYRGLNVAATLANALGTTEEEIRELVHDGQIDFQTFADAMDDAFGEHATEANKTFSGAFSNVKANLSKIGEMFATPAYDNLRKAFAALIPVIKDVKAYLEPLAAVSTTVMNKVGDGVAGFFNVIHSALSGEELKETSEEATETAEKAVSGIEKIRQAALEVIRGDYGNGQGRIDKLTEEGFDAQEVQDYVNKIHELTDGTWDITDAVLAETDAFFGSYDALSKISDEDLKAAGMSDEDITNLRESAKALEEQAEAAEETADAYDELDNKSKFVLALRNAFDGFKEIFESIGKAFKDNFSFKKADFNPIGFLATKLLDVSQNFKTFTQNHAKDVANIFLGIASAAQLVWKGVTLVGRTLLWIVATVLGAFGLSIVEIIGWVGSLITKFNNWIETSETLQGILDWLKTKIEGAATKVKEFFDGFIKIPKFYSGLTKIRYRFKTTFDKLPKHFEGTKKAFGDFKDRVKELGGIRLDNIGEVFQAFKDTVVKQFADFKPFEKIKQGFVDVTTTIRQHFDEMSVDAEGNETLFGKVWHTITAGYDWVAEKAGAAKDAVVNWFQQYNIGDFLLRNFNHFKTGLKSLWDHGLSFLQGLPGVFQEFWDKVQEAGGLSFDNLGNIFQAFKDTVVSYFKDFDGFNALGTAFTMFGSDIKKKIEEMTGYDINKLGEDLVAFKDKAIGALNDFASFLGDFDISEAFGKFIGFFTGKGEGGEEGGDITEAAQKAEGATTGFGAFLETMKKLVGDGDWILTLGKIAAALVVLKVTGIGTVLKDLATALSGFIASKAELDKAQAKDVRATAWLKTAGAIALIAFAIVKLGTIEVSQLEQGAKVVGVIAIALLAYSWLAGKLVGGAEIGLMGDGLLKFAGAIAVLAILATAINLVPWDVLISGLKKVAVIGGVLLVAAFALALIGKIAGNNDVANVAEGLSTFVVAVEKIGVMATVLAAVPWKTLQNGLKKVAAIGGVLLVAVFALSLCARLAGGKSAIGLGAVAGVVAAIGAVIWALAEFGDVKKYIPIAQALSEVIGAVSAILLVTKFTGGNAGSKAAANILELVGIIGFIGLILDKISDLANALYGDDVVDILGDLGDVFGKLGEGIGKFIGGIAVGAAKKMDELDPAIIDKIVGFVEKFANIKISPQKIKESAGLFGASSSTDQSLKTLAEGIWKCVDAINLFDVSEDLGDLDKKVKYFDDIVRFVEQMADIDVPEQYLAHVTALGGLFESAGVDKSLETFADGICDIVEVVNDIQTPPNEGDLARKKQYMQSITDFVSGLADIDIPEQYLGHVKVLGGLFESYDVDKSLDTFGDGMSSVIDAVKNINISPLDILLMGFKKQYMEQVTGFVQGLAGIEIPVQYIGKLTFLGISYAAVDQSLESFGKGMEAVVLAVNHLEFDGNDIALMNEKKQYMDNIADFTERMAAIEIPVQTSFESKKFFDAKYVNQSLAKFGQGLAEVVVAANALTIDPMVALTLPLKAVYFNIIADFVKKMAAIDIPVQTTNWYALGGLVGGGVDSSLYKFATGMKEVSVALNGMTKPNVSMEDIEFMSQAVQKMATAASFIPPQNEGITAWFNGDNTLTNFATEMKNSAVPIKNASKDAKGIDLASLTTLADGVGKMGDIMTTIIEKGGADITYYSTHLSEVTAFANAIDKVGGGLGKLSKLKDVKVEDINRIPEIIEALVAVNDKLKLAEGAAANADDTALQNIIVPFEAIGEATSSDSMPDSMNINAIVDAVNELQNLNITGGDGTNTELVTTLKTNVESLKSMIEDLVGVDTSGVDKLTKSTDKLANVDFTGTKEKIESKGKAKAQGEGAAKEGINAMASAYKNDTSVSGAASSLAAGALSAVTKQVGAFRSAGRQLVSAIAEGIGQKNTAKDAAVKIVTKAASAAKGESDRGNEAGAQFAKGYARGIDVNTSYVANVARAMVKKAAEAAKNEQASASPSKLTYKFGRWFVEGYSNAIHDYSDLAERSAGRMTKGTVSAMGDALNAVSDLIGSSDDFTPTITPLLDLSEVESRAAGLNGLFNTSPLIGTNLGIVAANSNAMRQSTSMTDLLSAMEDLSVAVGSASPVNNYTVNGVTYDDGSNVASAVGDLIRAARIERRA